MSLNKIGKAQKLKVKRPYPSSGDEYSRPHTYVARNASPEWRKKPVLVWVRCCNKMHPVKVRENGRLSIPAHPNLAGERMMIRMGAKEPRCLQILRLWQGCKPTTHPHDDMELSYAVYDHTFHRKLQKHMPLELLRVYCAGLRHRDDRSMNGSRRFKVKTPVLQDELAWQEPYEPDEDDPDKRPYWFSTVLPQMAAERLLVREIMRTPKLVAALKGRPMTGYSFSFSRNKIQNDSGYSYYYHGINLDISEVWCEKDKLRINGNLDPTFISLALNGKNRTAEGDLIIGRLDIGSNRYRGYQERIKSCNGDAYSGPGSKYVANGEKPIYIALTKCNSDVNDYSSDLIDSELGVLGERGEWLWLEKRKSN